MFSTYPMMYLFIQWDESPQHSIHLLPTPSCQMLEPIVAPPVNKFPHTWHRHCLRRSDGPPTFLRASSSSSFRTQPASISSGLVSGDGWLPSGPGTATPCPLAEPLPTTWGLPCGESSEAVLSGGGKETGHETRPEETFSTSLAKVKFTAVHFFVVFLSLSDG